jgi:integrase
MARLVKRLTALGAQKRSRPGFHPDGDGLYLQVGKTKTKSWVFRYTLRGRPRYMGLGRYQEVTLDEARALAAERRQQVKDGLDPIEARNAERRQRAVDQARGITFEQCAHAYIEAHRSGWKNAKHAAQWAATLQTYAYPGFGKLLVQEVDTALVMKVLDPIWREKTETASRVRGRIESVLDWATVREYRAGENPARWRGHLDKLLPKRSKVAEVKHHEALPYAEIGEFMRDLHEREGIAPKALEFIILTAARVSEAVNAKWDEIELQKALWTVPAKRMKAKRAHRVPLAPAAIKVLKKMEAVRQSDYVFPGWKADKPLSGAACLALLDDMNRAKLTVHGFRSTFRDWAAEQTNFPREIAEAALAHTLKDKTEAAYQRGDLLARRALLMNGWADYCAQRQEGNVVPLRPKGAAGRLKRKA